MELDRTTIKSLSSETRVDILKSLSRRRKMPTELAKEFGMAASTISEHLKNLEDSKLITKKETGHKWIYYELTEKGNVLVKPQYTPQFVVVLVLGGLIFLGGFASFLAPYSFSQNNFSGLYQISSLNGTPMKDAPDIKPQEEFDALKLTIHEAENRTVEDIKITPVNLYTIILFIVGLVMMVSAFVLPKKYRLEVG